MEHFYSLEERLDPKHTAVIVVDMQNDFCHENGGLAKNGGDVTRTQAIVPALNALIADARKVDVPVIFVRASHNNWTDSEPRKAKQLGRQHAICAEGTWGCDWYGVAPEPGDCVVTKHRFSAFINTDLELILRAQGIKTLVMTGTATNVCVESTARDGFMLDYFIAFVDDCCGTGDEAAHNATLRNFRKDTVTSDVVKGVWAKIAREQLVPA